MSTRGLKTLVANSFAHLNVGVIVVGHPHNGGQWLRPSEEEKERERGDFFFSFTRGNKKFFNLTCCCC